MPATTRRPPLSLVLFLVLFFLLAILAAPVLAQEETPVSPTLDPNAGGRALQVPDWPAVTSMQTEVTLLSGELRWRNVPTRGVVGSSGSLIVTGTALRREPIPHKCRIAVLARLCSTVGTITETGKNTT